MFETFEIICFQSRVLGIYVAPTNLFVGVLNNHLSKLHNFSKFSVCTIMYQESGVILDCASRTLTV